VKTEYNNLRTFQFYNHFSNSRELTTKQGLNKNLYSILAHDKNVYEWYPRSYDLSDQRQIEAFIDDFKRTAILGLLKKHARLFKERVESIKEMV